MTTLVTGSSGHLGEALVRTFRGMGRPVSGIDIKPSAFTDRVGSICDREFLGGCMTGVRAVFHTATLHKPHLGTHGKQAFVDTNVSGTLALLELAAVSADRPGVCQCGRADGIGTACEVRLPVRARLPACRH